MNSIIIHIKTEAQNRDRDRGQGYTQEKLSDWTNYDHSN